MYSKILVPVDGSVTSDQGLAEAIRLAKLTGGQLELLHVNDLQSLASLPDTSLGLTPEVFTMMREGGEALLARCRASAEAAGVVAKTRLSDVYGSRVSDQVVDEARRWGAEIIVLGTHGRRGLGRALLGSDAELIARYSPVPVLLVRGAEPVPPAA
jgi:nucleotide-binding universal stress UspA family protein